MSNLTFRQEHIIFLGEAGFPVGLGAIQRMTLIGKSLIHENCKVTVLCRKGIFREGNSHNVAVEGTFEGIAYVYTSGSVLRPKGFLKRNLMKVKGMAGELRFLYRLKKSNNLTAAIISSHSAFQVLCYRFFSLLIGFPIILNFVEMASSMKGRDAFLVKMNDYIFDKFIVRIVDGALPISDKLMDYYERLAPSKPRMKLPILCDFKKFGPPESSVKEITFLYCGAASYLELIEFVIDAFEALKLPDRPIHLQLILGGNETEIKKVKKRIMESNRGDSIGLTANVAHSEIPNYYSKASALLIPLRPSVQDEARFPHKIGEYLASGRPMITSAFGEINNYAFIDRETALVASDYNVKSFSEKMRYIIENPLKSDEIGRKGRQMGLANFDYLSHGKKLLNYFVSLNSSSR